MDISQLIQIVLGLGGVGAVISALVNVGKTLKWIKDGQAQNWVTGGNLLVMIGVFVLTLLGKTDVIQVIDPAAGTIAQIITLVFGLVIQLLSSKLTHFALKGTAIVGKSYSVEAAKAKAFQDRLVR